MVLRMRRTEQHAAFVFIGWAGNADLGNAAQKGYVVNTCMCGTVCADDACAVQRQHHGQFLQSHIVYQLVIGAL